MIIRKFGMEFRRLEYGDIELVRTMRNRPDIRNRMDFQGHITPEMQEKWFESVNNSQNYYFIIFSEGKSVGLIHGKNVDFAARECEGGIFIWEHSLLGTGVPARASICFLDFAFHFLLLEKVYARVRSDNVSAYRYNMSLGFESCGEGPDTLLVLTRDRFVERAERLRAIAGALANDVSPLSSSDIQIEDLTRNWDLYRSLPLNVQESLGVRGC